VEALQRVDFKNMSMGPHAWHREVDPKALPNTMDLHMHLPKMGTPKVRQPITARPGSALLCSALLSLARAGFSRLNASDFRVSMSTGHRGHRRDGGAAAG
jgi:hypothetical protein